jgi:hypothetical protein
MIEEYIAARLAEHKARATVNRETGALRQAFSLASRRKPAKLTRAPYVPMLNEDNARHGFFEADEFASVLASLPAPLDDIARFAYLSGWRKLWNAAAFDGPIRRSARSASLSTWLTSASASPLTTLRRPTPAACDTSSRLRPARRRTCISWRFSMSIIPSVAALCGES